MTTPSYDAVVVGSGYAGLRAARDLRDAGCQVLLLEGRDRVGGRCLTGTVPGYEQQLVDFGGAWVNPRHNEYVAGEMDRYGLKLAEEHGPEPHFLWRFDGRTSNEFPVQGEEMFDLERAVYRIIEAARRIDTRVPRDLQELEDLDVSVEDFLKSCGLSGRAYEFFSGFGSLGSGAESSQWSALTAFSLMGAFGASAYAWFAGVAEKLEGGSRTIVDALLEDASPELRLSTPVVGVEQGDDAVTLVVEDGTRIEAAAAVLAVPLNVWGDIEFTPALAAGKAAFRAEPHPNRMGKFWAAVRGAPVGAMGFGPDSDILFIAPQYEVGDDTFLMVGFSAPPNLLDVKDKDAVAAAIEEYYPQAEVLEVAAHDWGADRFSKGGWQTYRPGQATSLHSALQEPEGRVFFASADTAVRWIGWFDGALESGARAASQALELLAPGNRDAAPAGGSR